MRIALALFALTFLPGIPLTALLVRRLRDGISRLAVAGSLGIVWSTWVTFLLVAARVPLRTPLILIACALPLLPAAFSSSIRGHIRTLLGHLIVPPATAVILALTIVVLAYPFLTVQRGLPTGDVQKSIFWAERILTTNQLPQYAEALRLNRDPGDFAIPGLHTLTAALIELSGDAFRGPAWFALVTALLLAGLGATLAALLAPRSSSVLPLATFLLAATNIRFLRYVLAPGYHYQNLVGELLLILAFLFLLHTVGGRGGQRTILLAGITAAALPLVHQFSAFLGLLLLPIIFLLLVVRYRGEAASLVAHLPPRVRWIGGVAAMAALIGAILAAVRGPLAEKLPHLFTRTPHLTPYVIPLTSIPAILGTTLTLLAAAGVVLVLVQLRRRELEWRWWLLLLWTVLLFALSQGARTVIDIPSARTLFYLTTPLALFAALLVTTAIERISALWPRSSPALVPVACALALAPTAGVALNNGIQTIDHRVQSNATLTPETLNLLSFLSSHPPTCPAATNIKEGSKDEQPAGSVPSSAQPEQAPDGSRAGVDRPSGHGVPPEAGRAREGVAASAPRWGARAAVSRPNGASSSGCADAILIDDWNRRRTTWALLSPWRMLTRVGADLSVIAREAGQSDQRQLQYLTLLEFEKIYALGNSPAVVPLLTRNGIGLLVGVKGLSADVFSANPSLEPVYEDSEAVIFRPRADGSAALPAETAFLIAPETLANDIGDAEDVFAHLPLSLLAPQISETARIGDRTTRDVRSAVSGIGLNVGVYVPALWDENGDRLVDGPVDVLLIAIGNGASGRLTRGTTVYAAFELPADGAVHEIRTRIPAGELPIDDQGLVFLTLRLDRGPLQLDLAGARIVPLDSTRSTLNRVERVR